METISTNTQKPIVLVTGSSGLIGTALIRRLVERYQVIGFDLKEPKGTIPGSRCLHLDITSDQAVTDAIEQVRREAGDRIASVIHLAAYYDFSGEPSDLYERVTVRGTERLLRALQTLRVEQFVFSSTMLVHAPGEPGRPINEDHPIEAKWDYPRSKVDAENVIRRERGNISVVMMRIAGVYDEKCHSVPISQQIRRIHLKQFKSRVYPGDTRCGQALVHLEDLVESFALAVEKRRELPEETILLIGEDATMSYEELQQAFGRLIHGKEWSTWKVPKLVAKTGAWVEAKSPIGGGGFIKPWMIDLADDHYELDIGRARELLGWQPNHSLRETLPRMVAFLKSDPRGFYSENKLGLPGTTEERDAAS